MRASALTVNGVANAERGIQYAHPLWLHDPLNPTRHLVPGQAIHLVAHLRIHHKRVAAQIKSIRTCAAVEQILLPRFRPAAVQNITAAATDNDIVPSAPIQNLAITRHTFDNNDVVASARVDCATARACQEKGILFALLISGSCHKRRFQADPPHPPGPHPA